MRRGIPGPGQIITVFLPFVMLAAAVTAQEQPEAPQTGVFTTRFTERSPLSDLERIAAVIRLREEDKPKVHDWDLGSIEFQLVVPEGYDGSEPYGLLVFIHPNSDVNADANNLGFYGNRIRDVLARHKLIWVSFDQGGNEDLWVQRLGLALDAVHNATQRYHIDDKRVYVSGMSGGGRMTCVAGIYYPEVFDGAIPIVGTQYFRNADLPDDPALRAKIRPEPPAEGGVWPRGLWEPSARQLRDMRANQRWVLLAGENDFNMPQMRAHYEQGFQHDRFEYAHYLEVPGMGHALPEAEWFEKAIVLLDEPLAALDPANLPPADERTQAAAARRLEVALRALERDRDRGVRALERLVEDMPNTAAAAQAREKLDELRAEELSNQ